MLENWDHIWRTAPVPSSINAEEVALLVLAGCLTSLSMGFAGHALLKSRDRQLSIRKAASNLAGYSGMFILLSLPVVFVMLRLFVPALMSFQHNFGELQPDSKSATKLSTDSESGINLGQPAKSFDESSPSVGNQDEENEAPSQLPEWVRQPETTLEEGRLIVISGEQYPALAKAHKDALDVAVRAVKEDFQQTHSAAGDWRLPVALVKREAIRQEYVETITRETELNSFQVYRVYYQLELSPQVRKAVFTSWRNQIVEKRLWILGSLVGFVALVLGTTATYLRLDALTGGLYRRRLKLASVSLLIAGGLSLAAILPIG